MTKTTKLGLAAVALLASSALADPPKQEKAPPKQEKAPPKTPAATNAPTTKAPTTIVLVHGAFAEGSSWDKVIPLLQAKGYNVVAVHEPMTGLADDVAATKRVIHAQAGDVILVGHSYGGAVITEAGNDDKVTGLVYVAAFGPDANESISDLGKGQPIPDWQKALKVDEGGFAYLPLETMQKDFSQDLPAAETKVMAAKQGWLNSKAFDEKVKTAAWKTKPSWYIRASQDRMIDPNAEAGMAKRMKATLHSVDASHVVMLSHPKEVAQVILQAAGAQATAQK